MKIITLEKSTLCIMFYFKFPGSNMYVNKNNIFCTCIHAIDAASFEQFRVPEKNSLAGCTPLLYTGQELIKLMQVILFLDNNAIQLILHFTLLLCMNIVTKHCVGDWAKLEGSFWVTEFVKLGRGYSSKKKPSNFTQ